MQINLLQIISQAEKTRVIKPANLNKIHVTCLDDSLLLLLTAFPIHDYFAGHNNFLLKKKQVKPLYNTDYESRSGHYILSVLATVLFRPGKTMRGIVRDCLLKDYGLWSRFHVLRYNKARKRVKIQITKTAASRALKFLTKHGIIRECKTKGAYLYYPNLQKANSYAQNLISWKYWFGISARRRNLMRKKALELASRPPDVCIECLKEGRYEEFHTEFDPNTNNYARVCNSGHISTLEAVFTGDNRQSNWATWYKPNQEDEWSQ